MPVIQPQLAKTVIAMKRGQGTGFSGIDNPLFYLPNTVMLYGDAKKSLASLVSEVKGLSGSSGQTREWNGRKGCQSPVTIEVMRGRRSTDSSWR